VKLLAIETSTEACSAALHCNGETIERFQLAPREHTRLILPMVDELLAAAQLLPQQLDALAFGRGPGSFTGVRIATGVTQGIALGADLPVVPVSTLAAIAYQHFAKSDVTSAFVAMDARMEEIFWGVYIKDSDNGVQLQGEEVVTSATAVIFPKQKKGVGLGSGWKTYQGQLSNCLGEQLLSIDNDCLPTAAAVAELGVIGFNQGRAVDVEQAMPVYLRNKVAKKESER